jgi:hypothetical protein
VSCAARGDESSSPSGAGAEASSPSSPRPANRNADAPLIVLDRRLLALLALLALLLVGLGLAAASSGPRTSSESRRPPDAAWVRGRTRLSVRGGRPSVRDDAVVSLRVIASIG